MTSKPQAPAEHSVILLPGIHDEALRLLVEAHNYFQNLGSHEQMRMAERDRIMYTREMSRVTIRLSCVMAWLLARRAVLTGQITADEAGMHYRLECRDVCMDQHIEAESLLPKRMVDLLDKTLDLYQRVARLDKAPEKES